MPMTLLAAAGLDAGRFGIEAGAETRVVDGLRNEVMWLQPKSAVAAAEIATAATSDDPAWCGRKDRDRPVADEGREAVSGCPV